MNGVLRRIDGVGRREDGVGHGRRGVLRRPDGVSKKLNGVVKKNRGVHEKPDGVQTDGAGVLGKRDGVPGNPGGVFTDSPGSVRFSRWSAVLGRWSGRKNVTGVCLRFGSGLGRRTVSGRSAAGGLLAEVAGADVVEAEVGGNVGEQARADGGATGLVEIADDHIESPVEFVELGGVLQGLALGELGVGEHGVEAGDQVGGLIEALSHRDLRRNQRGFRCHQRG